MERLKILPERGNNSGFLFENTEVSTKSAISTSKGTKHTKVFALLLSNIVPFEQVYGHAPCPYTKVCYLHPAIHRSHFNLSLNGSKALGASHATSAQALLALALPKTDLPLSYGVQASFCGVKKTPCQVLCSFLTSRNSDLLAMVEVVPETSQPKRSQHRSHGPGGACSWAALPSCICSQPRRTHS